MSQAVRFSHVLIIFIVFAMAIVLGTSYTSEINDYAQSKLSQQCSSEYLNECIYRQLIYRASFSLTILFTILSISILLQNATGAFDGKSANNSKQVALVAAVAVSLLFL